MTTKKAPRVQPSSKPVKEAKASPVDVAPKAAPTVQPTASKAVPAPKVVATKAPAKNSVKAAIKPVADKPTKVKKPKLVRDSLTMPKAEYEILDALKVRATALQTHIKKTELIRAGIKALAAMNDAAFLAAIKAVPSLKTGRPSKY